MSWWDTSHLTSLASNALKNAQKKIDKVLDIPTEDDDAASDRHSTTLPAKAVTRSDDDKASSSWSAWGSTSLLSPKTSPREETKKQSHIKQGESPLSSPVIQKPNASPSPSNDSKDNFVTTDTAEVDLMAELSYNSSVLDPIAASSPQVPSASASDKALERRERAAQRKAKASNDKPLASKKQGLGAVKLGGVKVKKIHSNSQSEEESTAPPASISNDTDFSSCELLAMDRQADLQDEHTATDKNSENVIQSPAINDTLTQPDENKDESSVWVPTQMITELESIDQAGNTNPQDYALSNEQTVHTTEDAEQKELIAEDMKVGDPVKQVELSDNSELMGLEASSCVEEQNLIAENPVLDDFSKLEQEVVCERIEQTELSFDAVPETDQQMIDEDEADHRIPAVRVPESEKLMTAAAEKSEPPQLKAESEVPQQALSQELSHLDESLPETIEEPLDGRQDTSSNSYEAIEGNDDVVNDSQKEQQLDGGMTTSHSSNALHISTEESVTPKGSSADLIVKSSSSESTVVDQPNVFDMMMQDATVEPDAGNTQEINEHSHDQSADQLHDKFVEASQISSAMVESTCSDKSYVKCERPSPFPRSDSNSEFRQGAPSEFSDIETGTSSDIEIISMASTYGDGNGDARLMDFVPLSRTVFKTKMREISPDEMSSNSSQHSPSGEREDTDDRSLQGNKSHDLTATSAPSDNPLDSQNLLKKLAQLSEVLEARESKLVTVSREHSELLEVNAHLKRRIEQMEENNGELDIIKMEFGERLHELERKYQNALREKDAMKQQMLTMQQELKNRSGTSDKMARLVEDKDEQISSLMMEGEKLAKQQLQSNNLIKKLRRKEKEQEETTKALREKVESLQNEVSQLKTVLDSKIANEKEHTDMIKQLNNAVTNYQAEVNRLKSETEEATEKMKRAESVLDNSYKEIADLNKSLAAKDSQIKELKSSNDEQLREELQKALEKRQKQALRDSEHLTGQIEDLQISMSRMEKDHQRREDCLQQEIQDLMAKLDSSDKRNDDLTNNIAAATKPLLRQIENLQSSYSAQSSSWEKLEKNLTDRLTDAQNQLAIANEKERLATERNGELSSRLTILEGQLTPLKQEKSKLSAELEVYKMKLNTLVDEKNGAISQLETFRSSMEMDSAESKKAYAHLESRLELERAKVDTEKKKVVELTDQLNEKEKKIQELKTSKPIRNTPSPSSNVETGPRNTLRQEEMLERALSTSSFMSSSSLYDSVRHHSTTTLLENLESLVKQREGEIIQLQTDIQEHEKTRESLTKEMIKLTEENAKQDTKIKQLNKLQTQFKELNARYQALLQMYGEKEEEVSELKMDLEDVKQMYKQQIDALLSK